MRYATCLSNFQKKKIEISPQISEKFSNIKFQYNSPRAIRDVAIGKTDMTK